MVVKLVKQALLSLLEALGKRPLLPFQGIDPLQGTGGGLPQPLAKLNLAPLSNQLAAQLPLVSGVGVLQVGQTLSQMVHGRLVVGQLALGHGHPLLGRLPLPLPGPLGDLGVSIAVVDVEVGPVDQIADA